MPDTPQLDTSRYWPIAEEAERLSEHARSIRAEIAALGPDLAAAERDLRRRGATDRASSHVIDEMIAAQPGQAVALYDEHADDEFSGTRKLSAESREVKYSTLTRAEVARWDAMRVAKQRLNLRGNQLAQQAAPVRQLANRLKAHIIAAGFGHEIGESGVFMNRG